MIRINSCQKNWISLRFTTVEWTLAIHTAQIEFNAFY